MNPLTGEEAALARESARAIITQVERVIVGKRETIELVIIALLARGHVLIEDIPGVGKTMLAKAMARAVGGSFKRIQFTPDLLPGDVTGLSIYNQKTTEFVFNLGPVFANVVLADEINRATPKTQSALLEAMEEAQVTVEGTTRPLPRPFFVIATQNPIEYRGTYPLPEAQMDRFLLRVRLGYPHRDEEVDLLARHAEAGGVAAASAAAGAGRLASSSMEPAGVSPAAAAQSAAAQNAPEQAESTQAATLLRRVETVLSVEAAHRLQLACTRVFVAPATRDYIVGLTAATRGHVQLALGASPRGSLALQRAAQAAALLQGREFATLDDVKRLAPVVLPHRLIPHDAGPGFGGGGAGAATLVESLVRQLLDELPVPAAAS